jgi:hypothetical protein
VNTLFEPRVTGRAVGGQAPATVTPEYLQTREALRQWRLTQPLDRFREIRRRFESAGILRTIRDNKWPIACILEQGRTGFDSPVAATKANLDYMRKVLDS